MYIGNCLPTSFHECRDYLGLDPTKDKNLRYMECSGEFDGVFDASDPEMLKLAGIDDIGDLLLRVEGSTKAQAYGEACLKLEKYAIENGYTGILYKSAQTEARGIVGGENLVLFSGRWKPSDLTWKDL